ncbi:MAG: LysR substrate-binding domain-containing protein [Myxococcota bacterium]
MLNVALANISIQTITGSAVPDRRHVQIDSVVFGTRHPTYSCLSVHIRSASGFARSDNFVKTLFLQPRFWHTDILRKNTYEWPTLSKRLAALRAAFEDPLFVRTSRGLSPTPFALSLSEPLSRVIASIDSLLDASGFDPKTSRRTYRLHMPDVLAGVIMKDLESELSNYPGLSLELFSSEGKMSGVLLEQRSDLVVGVPKLEHPDFYSRTVPKKIGWSVVCGPQHPDFNLKRMSYASWLRSSHLQLLPDADPSVDSALDRILLERGVERRVRLRLQFLSGVADVLESTSMVASLPTSTSQWLSQRRRLRVMPHPLRALSPFSVRLTWHSLLHKDASQRWFRDLIARSLQRNITTRAR